ncbi:MAG: hypothetical protein HFJ94_03370 [Muribaculaceae bacterium]|nr:hypothetical protein [Muribaculaceae bacterium]
MMKPAAWIKAVASIPLRAWRTRGFGIHSPFAFKFVNDVLRCRNAYYAYSTIGTSAADRRLYRILLHLAPSAVVRSGPLSPGQHAAIDAALSDTAASPQCHKAVIVSPGSIVGIAYIKRILADGGCAVFTDLRKPDCAEIFSQVYRCGMSFSGIRQAVITGRPSLPHQKFDVLI